MGKSKSKTKYKKRSVKVWITTGIKKVKRKNKSGKLTILKDGRLRVKQHFFFKKPFYLNISQITKAAIILEDDDRALTKNVMNQALRGFAYLGIAGASLLGGNGPQIKKIVINYLSFSSGESVVLSFIIPAKYHYFTTPGVYLAPYEEFVNEILEIAGLVKEQEEISNNL